MPPVKDKRPYFKVMAEDVDSGKFDDWSFDEFRVWFRLKRRQDKCGHCRPGQRRLREETGLTFPAIKAAIDLLESRGVLLAIKEKGKVTHYQMIL